MVKLKKFLALFMGNKKYLPNWEKISINTRVESDNKKTFLIATLSGGLLTPLVFESLLGVSLKSRGHDVEFLLCDGVLSACIMCAHNVIDEDSYVKDGPKKFCNSCFINAYNFLKPTKCKIRVLSDYLSDEDELTIKNLSLENKTLEELKRYSLENMPIGEHAYAGALRYYGITELDSNKNSKKILIEYLKSGIKSYLASKKLFEIKKYDEVILNHGIYVPQGIINLAAKEKKINVTNWCPGVRKKSFCLTRGDTYHRSLIYENNDNWEKISYNDQIDNRIKNYLNSRTKGKNDWIHWQQKPDLDIDTFLNKIKIDRNKPIIGLPTNVMWDAQIDFPSNFFKNFLEWVFFTIDYFSSRADIQLLIRIHPAEVDKTKPARQRLKDEILKKYKSLPSNIFIIEAENEISTYPLMKICSSVLVYGSRMGVELPALGTPVIVCGEGFIRNKKIAIDIISKENYIKVLKELPLKNYKVDIIRAKKYAYHFFFRRMIIVKSVIEKPKQWPNIDIDKNLNKILNEKSDPGLEKIIKCFEDGNDFIFDDENFIKNEELDLKVIHQSVIGVDKLIKEI